MRKLLITLALAGTLSVPSVVFADEMEAEEKELTVEDRVMMLEDAAATGARWYGSLRIGVESSDSNIGVSGAGASRWGIMGSHEAGEGLTAVYRFEQGITVDDAEQFGRLSYVGISGGFGSLTLGRIWSASYNKVGAMLDRAWYYGNAGTSFRLGDAVSYAFSNDLMSLQVDAVYGSPSTAAAANDYAGMREVAGLTVDAFSGISGDQAGLINLARKEENLQQVEFGLSVNIGDMGRISFAHVDDKHSFADANSLTQGDDAETAVTSPSSWSSKNNVVAGELSVADLTVYLGSGKVSYKNTTGAADNDTDATDAADGRSAVKADEKTTFFGLSGALGDTGVGYVFQWNDVKSSGANPWVISLTKGLGDHSSVVLEHANSDAGSKSTQVGLVVNF